LLFAKSNSDFEPSYVLSSANFSPDSRPDFFRESGAGAGVAKRGSRGEKSGAGVTPDATLLYTPSQRPYAAEIKQKFVA